MRHFVLPRDPCAACCPRFAAPRSPLASRGPQPLRFASLALWLLCAAGACKGVETNLQDTEVSAQATARQNYEAAEAAFAAERFNESIKYFEHVKNQFPYSKYAILADLRIADAHFARERWLEAAETYRLFVRFHPRHEQVPHATWRIALAYHRAMQQDFFLLPPAHEIDLSATNDAIRAFDDYLRRYPEGEHAKEASTLRIEARTRLAEHDLYAARFYEKREKWQGALWRYERVMQEFADTPRLPTALLAAGRICADALARPDDALRYFQRVVDEFPKAEEGVAARAALTRLQAPSSPAPGGEG